MNLGKFVNSAKKTVMAGITALGINTGANAHGFYHHIHHPHPIVRHCHPRPYFRPLPPPPPIYYRPYVYPGPRFIPPVRPIPLPPPPPVIITPRVVPLPVQPPVIVTPPAAVITTPVVTIGL